MTMSYLLIIYFQCHGKSEFKPEGLLAFLKEYFIQRWITYTIFPVRNVIQSSKKDGGRTATCQPFINQQ